MWCVGVGHSAVLWHCSMVTRGPASVAAGCLLVYPCVWFTALGAWRRPGCLPTWVQQAEHSLDQQLAAVAVVRDTGWMRTWVHVCSSTHHACCWNTTSLSSDGQLLRLCQRGPVCLRCCAGAGCRSRWSGRQPHLSGITSAGHLLRCLNPDRPCDMLRYVACEHASQACVPGGTARPN